MGRVGQDTKLIASIKLGRIQVAAKPNALSIALLLPLVVVGRLNSQASRAVEPCSLVLHCVVLLY